MCVVSESSGTLCTPPELTCITASAARALSDAAIWRRTLATHFGDALSGVTQLKRRTGRSRLRRDELCANCGTSSTDTILLALRVSVTDVTLALAKDGTLSSAS